MKYVFIVLGFMGLMVWATPVAAQCDFTLQANVVQHADCMSNGAIEVKVSGAEGLQLGIMLVGGAISEYANTNDKVFMGLPPNEYTLTVNASCANGETAVKTMTLVVEDRYEEMVAYIDGYQTSTMNCMHTGMIPIVIRDGYAPYTVTMDGAPPAYTGAKTFTLNYPQVLELDSLPAGYYNFTIIDACGYSLPSTASITKVTSDFPDHGVDMRLLSSGCRQAFIDLWWVDGSSPLAYYWNNHRSQYFEIAVSFDGTKNWVAISDDGAQYVNLPDTYLNLHNQDKKADIYLRLKGTTCERYLGEAGLPATISHSEWVEKECAYFKWNLNMQDNTYILCQPFNVEVFEDASGDRVFSLLNSNELYVTVDNLLYNKNYTIKITDAEGQVFTYTTIQQNYQMEIYEEWIYPGCDTYGYYIAFNRACFPLRWELYHSDTIVTVGSIPTDYANWIGGMEYGKNYRLLVIDDGGDSISRDISSPGGPPSGGMSIMYSNEGCDTYDATLNPTNFCPPFDFEILDPDGWTITDDEGLGEIHERTITGLEYDKLYTVTIKDNKGQNLSFAFENPRKPMVIPDWACYVSQYNCYDYVFHFDLDHSTMYCYPYKWEMFDESGALVASQSGFMEKNSHEVHLEYNKNYRLVMTDSKGRTAERDYIYQGSDRYKPTYNLWYYQEICNSGLGTMGIRGNLDSATRIYFVVGPQTPVHPDVTLTEDLMDFFPFSEDYRNESLVQIAAGVYVFEITDRCGTIHTYAVEAKSPLAVVNFGYSLAESCEGISRLHPTGLLYDNGFPTTTVYKLEYPDGSVQWQYYYDGFNGFFAMGSSGTYRLSINYGHESCQLREIVIEYEKNSFTLEGRSSYVCEMNTGQGKIHVQARNGKPPYTYELLYTDMSPVGVPANNTGEFNFGAYGERYIVRITDDCGKRFPVEVVINTLDNIPLISGTPTVCNNGHMELRCIFIGAEIYEWTTPRGVVNDRVLTLDNITATDAGKYKIRVKPAGCDLSIYDSIDISVLSPPAPAIADTFSLCKGAPDKILSVAPLLNHSIQWYDNLGAPLTGEPRIPTSTVAEYLYFVEQTDNSRGCSTRRPVRSIVYDIVDENVSASGWSCPQANPTLEITGAIAGYTYCIYGNSALTDTIIEFRGTGSNPMSLTLPRTVERTSVFYLGIGSEGCRSNSGTSTVNIPVDEISIEPATLPIYEHDQPYSVRFSTNAIPVFSFEGSLVSGLTFTADGLLSGTVPSSAGHETSEFTLTVRDAKNCPATRAYVLQTCEPAPDSRDTAYCQGTVAAPLSAVSNNQLPLKWYDEYMQELPAAPTPDTRVPGVQTFYVSQVNTAMGCESPLTTIVVRIDSLPEARLLARADRVCINNPTNIHLDSLNVDYRYLIFNDSLSTDNALASVVGAGNGTVPMNENLTANHTYYIRVLDDAGCLSSEYREARAEVIDLDIQPETLAPYVVNQAYEQVFETNASPATFSLAGVLPSDITFSIDGRLSGIIREANLYSEFTVTVTDTANCSVSRHYLLAGTLVVPKVFTPNGDGINDIFMPTYKVVIFDRLGIELYSGTDGWNGTYNNKPVPIDIYFYKIYYPDPQSGTIKYKTGYVGVER